MEWSQKDGDSVHKGLQFGKVYGKPRTKELSVIFRNSLKREFIIFTNSCAGRAHNIVVAERVALNFMQRMSGIATLTKVLFSPLKKKIEINKQVAIILYRHFSCAKNKFHTRAHKLFQCES